MAQARTTLVPGVAGAAADLRPPCSACYNMDLCSNDNCTYSHQPADIDAWRRSHPAPCIHGSQCAYNARRRCIYYHPTLRSRPRDSGQHGQMPTMRTRDPLVGLSDPEDVMHLYQGGDGCQEDENDADSENHASPLFTIRDERVLASYNKVADNIIAVPGCPPQLRPLAGTVHLSCDSQQDSICDRHRAYPRYTHALEPLVRSVQCMTPDFDVLASSDVVTNAGSLYRLVYFFAGNTQCNRRVDLEWRTRGDRDGKNDADHADHAGDDDDGILLMQAWSDDPNNDISYGWGASFADTVSTYAGHLPTAIKESFSHHRVLSYALGGLRFVLHCEADAFYDPLGDAPVPSVCQKPSPPQTPAASPTMTKISPIPITRSAVVRPPPVMFGTTPPLSPKSMGSRFSVLFVEDGSDDDNDQGEGLENERDEDLENEQGEALRVPAGARSDTLTVKYPCGVRVPAAQLVEVKTITKRSLKRRRRPDVSVQLYFCRCLNLYEARHTDGVFEGARLRVKAMAAQLAAWERARQHTLAAVVAFVRRLRATARAKAAHGHCRLSIVFCRNGKANASALLYLRHDDGPSFLPDDL